MLDTTTPSLRTKTRPDRNYPLNCWWVAAASADVTREPLARTLLDMPVVLYRTEDGMPVALDDRCMHRWAPLSAGWLEGDNLVCPYHGARFSADGRCVRFPTQNAVPRTARVRSYPVVERGPYIWIWMGDDARKDAADLPPDFADYTGEGWTVAPGYFYLEANYMLLHENVLDLTHFNYVHRNSFRILNRAPGKYRAEGDKVYLDDDYLASDMTDDERERMGMGGPYVTHQETRASFETPAFHFALTTTFRESNPDLPDRWTNQISHFLTPESPTRSHYWWLHSMDMPMPPEAIEGMKAMAQIGFGEDRVLLASIQRIIDTDPRGGSYPELSFEGDAGSALVRRALARILAAD